ncbi:MAG: HAD family hydrolase [Clostridia bacterium]|nr:HAD family hydrolase [Clostridia bacterium]
MIRAVFFDLDGTLIDSLNDLAASTNYVLKQHGYPDRPTAEFPYFVGDGIPKMIERALPETARDKITVQKLTEDFLAYYAVHYADQTVVYAGMPEMVKVLKQQGFRLAVITNKAQIMADTLVKRLYGENTFDLIVGKQEGVPGKPDATSTLRAMEALSLLPEECAFLGDSGVDMLTAVHSGALPIGELWGYRKEDELLQNGARIIIQKPSDLANVINEVNGCDIKL